MKTEEEIKIALKFLKGENLKYIDDKQSHITSIQILNWVLGKEEKDAENKIRKRCR